MSEQTRQAIDAAIRAHSDDEWEGDLPVDWVIVAGLIAPDGTHTLAIDASRENIPHYVTVGLLTEGMRLSDPRPDDE